MSPNKPKIAVLISGGGTTLKNLISWSDAGKLMPAIACVISSSPKAGGLSFAADAGIGSHVVDWKQAQSEIAFSEQVFDLIRQHHVDWVIMGGFLRKLLIPADFENRVVNIHPSLIPAFCGQGYYGQRVHQAVIDFGCKLSGCTVHFVDNEFDHGPIIAQVAVSVFRDDRAEDLAARVFEAECELYPETINRLCRGTVQINGRAVSVS
ncbi:MAG: phosphoribosylglycinamide formyltransferase [Pirellulaceae bacterium]